MTRVRDGLPEHNTYRDVGCSLYGACLSCPLPRCRFELKPGQARMLANAVRLADLLEQGRTMDEAAVELGVSRRTVYRLRHEMPRQVPVLVTR